MFRLRSTRQPLRQGDVSTTLNMTTAMTEGPFGRLRVTIWLRFVFGDYLFGKLRRNFFIP